MRSAAPITLILALAETALSGIITEKSITNNTCGVTPTDSSFGAASGINSSTLSGSVQARLTVNLFAVGIPKYCNITESVSVTIDATTLGPLRPGYIELDYSAFGSGGDAGVLAGAGGGSIEGLVSWLSQNLLTVHDHVLLPYMLGTPFEVKLTALSRQGVNVIDPYFGEGRSSFALIIHDELGPFVQIVDIPEPRGLGLIGLLMLGGGYRYKRRR